MASKFFFTAGFWMAVSPSWRRGDAPQLSEAAISGGECEKGDKSNTRRCTSFSQGFSFPLENWASYHQRGWLDCQADFWLSEAFRVGTQRHTVEIY